MPKIDAPAYLNLRKVDFKTGVNPYTRDGLPLYKRLNDTALLRLKKLAIDSIWAFADLIDFYGGTPSFDPIHEELGQFLTSTWENRLVLMPRGHFKSTFGSTLMVMWRIYQNPNVRIMVGSARRELTTGFVRQIMQFFEDKELQEYVWNSRPHFTGPLVPDIDRTREKRRKGKNTGDDPDAFGDEILDPEDAVGKKVLWRANALQVIRPKNLKEPTLFSCSIGMIMTGWHFDLAIMDDLCTPTNSDTIEKVTKIKDWVNDVTSVLDPRGLNGPELGEEMVFLGTRYYKHDLYGYLMGTDLDSEEEKQEYWDTLPDDPLHVFMRDIYGNGCGTIQDSLWSQTIPTWTEFTTGHYMCPKLMNERVERKKRKKAKWFYSQYLNQIWNPDELLLDYEALQWFDITDTKRVLNQTIIRTANTSQEDPGIFLKLVTVVDPAASVNKTADYMCITTGGIDQNNNMYILDTKYGHWMPSEFAKEISDQLDRWQQTRVYIEANGVQRFIVNTLKEQFKVMGKTYNVVDEMPTGDKKQGILNTLEPYMSERRLWLPSWMQKLTEPEEEMKFFPAPGARDDFLDTLKMVGKHATPTKPLSTEVLNRRKLQKQGKVNKRYGGVR